MDITELLAAIEALRLSLEGSLHWSFKSQKKQAKVYEKLLLKLLDYI